MIRRSNRDDGRPRKSFARRLAEALLLMKALTMLVGLLKLTHDFLISLFEELRE
jgi:hypothetical protein